MSCDLKRMAHGCSRPQIMAQEATQEAILPFIKIFVSMTRCVVRQGLRPHGGTHGACMARHARALSMHMHEIDRANVALGHAHARQPGATARPHPARHACTNRLPLPGCPRERAYTLFPPVPRTSRAHAHTCVRDTPLSAHHAPPQAPPLPHPRPREHAREAAAHDRVLRGGHAAEAGDRWARGRMGGWSSFACVPGGRACGGGVFSPCRGVAGAVR
jgi:hypothetical protein